MLDRAKHIYERIMLELATRRKNEHVGSGLGGNPEEFLTMLALVPLFENKGSTEMFSIDGENLHIDLEKFTTAKFKEVRKALDAVLTKEVTDKFAHPEFVSLIESSKAVESPESVLVKSPKQAALLKAMQLADRMRVLVEKECSEDKSLKFEECSKELQSVHNDLVALDSWMTLVAVRVMIQIDRIVKYNLDETFGPLLDSINKKVDSIV